MPTLDEYRNNTGEFAPEQEQQLPDAAAEETVETPENNEEETETQETEEDTQEEVTLPDAQKPVNTHSDDEDEAQLSPKEKTAFEKRMERERRKLEEQLRKEYEEQANPYKEVIDLLGGDPAKIKENIQQNNIMRQAQQMADTYGWDEQQTQFYIQQEQAKIQQQSMQRELAELRIQAQINRLRDNPEYAGIQNLEKSIIEKVNKAGGALTVEEAYWALGGPRRAEQLKREAEQRMVVERSKKRTVVTETSAAPTGERPLPADVLQQARRMGLSEKEARELLSFDAGNLTEYRKKKVK